MKRLLPVVALATAAWFVYLAWPFEAPRRARAPEPPAPTPAAPEPARTPPQASSDGSAESRAGCVFEVDTRLAYELRFRSESEIVARLVGQPGDDPVRTESTQKMRMEVRVVEPTDREGQEPSAVLLAQFLDPSSVGTGRMPESLTAPFLLRVGDRCDLAGFARTSSVARADARVQQGFAYELNTYWSDGDAGPQVVDNATGRAQVDVAGRVKAGQRTIVQSVARYQELWRGKNDVALNFDRVPARSETTLTMGDGPWFERLRKEEGLQGLAGSSSSFVEARRVAPAAGDFDELPYTADDFVWENLLPQQVATPRTDPVTALDRKARDAVRHFTPETAAQRFMQRFESGAGIQDVWPELTHYLEARPEETDTLVSMMKRDEISTDASPAFYIALGRARTEQAKAALLDIMRDEIAPPVERIRAMFGLVDRQDVGVQLAEELARMARNITRGKDDATRVLGREALLALGAMAGLQENKAVTKVAVAAAALTVSEGQDAIERRPGYSAVANIGDPEYLSFAEGGMQSRDPREREAAAIVVRRMHPDDTSDFVADWLSREDDPYVKEALYTTVDLQTVDYPVPVGPRLVDQALLDLAAEPRVITRKAILNILGRAVPRYPRARQALIEQIPYELQEDSGIYDVIVRYLDPDEVRAAIANVGEVIDRGR